MMLENERVLCHSVVSMADAYVLMTFPTFSSPSGFFDRIQRGLRVPRNNAFQACLPLMHFTTSNKDTDKVLKLLPKIRNTEFHILRMSDKSTNLLNSSSSVTG